MAIVKVEKNSYTVDSLFQWDLNQVLQIYGLSLTSIPEIHFTNDAMDRAIVRQARMDAAGVITADVPNSLLQKPYKITAYVCIYEGDTFKSLYKIVIPVKARNKPGDYTLENDNEVYSFNALENLVLNSLSVMETKVNITLNAANTAVTEANKAANEAKKVAKETADEINKGVNDMLAVSDETKALYGLTPEDGIDDMFLKVDEELTALDPKVGDIMVSLRTDLGDKWLLTNGDSIDKSLYPELYNLFEDQIVNVAPFPSEASTVGDRVHYFNGYWVVPGRAKFNGTEYAAIFITTDPLNSWTAVKVASSTNGRINDVHYHDGLWVAVGYNSNTSDPAFYYARDPFGTWGLWEDTAMSSQYAYQMREVYYIDGRWLAFGSQDASTIGYQTTDPTLAWTSLNLSNNGFTYRDHAYHLAYANGLYVLGGDWYTGSGTTEYPSVYYTEDPTSTWTQHTVTTEIVEKQICSLAHGDGVWVALVATNEAIEIFTAAEVSGEWTRHSTALGRGGSATVHYCNGLWYICIGYSSGDSNPTYDGVWVATDPTGEWVNMREHTSNNNYEYSRGMAWNDDLIIFMRDKQIGVIKHYLPIITHDDSYTYIKAKE